MNGRPVRVRHRIATLRFRVTALATLAVLVVLSAASIALVVAQRSILTDNLDDSVVQKADILAASLRAGRAVAADALRADDVYVQVTGPDGTVVARSPSDGSSPVLPSAPDATVTTVTLPEGSSGRMATIVADGTTVQVAGSLDDVEESTAALAESLAVAVPISVAILAGVVWWSVGRTLRPVDDIRAEVERISERQLERRVPEPPTHDEVARLARTMNAMLDRLSVASERQRRFVGDASHELRGPLARIRSELEVNDAHPSTADLAATQRSVLEETLVLQQLVDDLLMLARGDAGALEIADPVPVSLDELVETCRSEAATGSAAVHVDTDVVPVRVLGDPRQLRRLLANLVENALQHAEHTVSVTLRRTPGDSAELAVADDGPGIPVEHAEDVFLRFTRLDTARPTTEGVGLGLAIARDIAERHGGSLILDTEHSPGARFVVTLPIDDE